MPGLNAAFERTAKAAEKRLEAEVKRLARRQEQQIESAAKRAADKAGQAIEAALKAALKNVESLADELRLTDQADRQNLRRGLETVNGIIAGAKRGAALGRVLGPEGAVIGGVVGGGVGGLLGLSETEVRLRAGRAFIDERRAQLEFELRLRADQERRDRLYAARTRAAAGVE